MINNYFRRIPKYYDDQDYTTNAPSYYDDLARKSKLIRLLSERIWEYDEELAKRFDAWDQNLEDLPDDLKRMLIDWIDDGTLDQIINETLFNQINDKTDKTKELLDQLVVNVKDFGAKGDGVTDDTESIQDALNHAHDLGGGTVYIPTGEYITSLPLYFKQGVNIKGNSVEKTRIIKINNNKLTNNLTYNHSQFGNINYNDYDAILMAVGRVGDGYIQDIRLDGVGGNDNEFKNDYGLLIFSSYRYTLNRVFIRYANEGLTMPSTWNTVLETVRIQHAGTGFKIGSWDGVTSTSVSFINTFVDYSDISYHITNVTYFSGTTMSSDFSTKLAYYFDTSYGSINGLGVEYAQGQWVKCHRSTINISGMYNLGIEEFTKTEPSISKALFEVTSLNRISTGLTITGSELRGSGNISNETWHVENGSFIHFIGTNLYSLLANTLDGFSAETSAVTRNDDVVSYKTRRFEVNDVNYTNERLLAQRIDMRADGRSFKYWNFNTSSNKTSLSIPVDEIKKAFPNFIDAAGSSFSLPYKLTIQKGTEGNPALLYDIILHHTTVNRDNEKKSGTDETDDVITSITLNSSELIINFPSNTRTWYVNISEL